MDKTVSELITEIERELHEVAGPATQVYGQDILVQRINAAFITFFDDKEVTWKRFIEYATYTLDGSTGKATGTVSTTFAQYEDILHVYPANSDRKLASWNTHRNPSLITGNNPVFIKPTATSGKVFQILPVTATGDVVVVGKQRPSDFPFDTLEDTVPFDYLALVYFVAWQELVDDGTNAASAELMQKKFQNRYKQLEAAQGRSPISFSGGSGQVPTRWFDNDA